MKYASLRHGLQIALCPSINGGGGILPDLSGRNYHGTLHGMSASAYVTGRKGRALTFDRVDDTISTSCPGIVTPSRSVSVWFKTSVNLTNGNYATISRWGTATTFPADIGKDFQVLFGTDANFGTNGIGISQYGDGVAVAGFNDGQWHHGAFMSIGSTYFVYVDGILRASKVMTTNAEAGTIRLGGYTASSLLFSGEVDDYRAYNRYLTETEIRWLNREPGFGLRPEPTSVFFGAQLFNAAWARNSNVILSPVGAA